MINKIKFFTNWIQRKRVKRNISDLPKTKNIVDFTGKEIFLWLKDYIDGWGRGYGVTPPDQYEIIKTELVRRNNERMLLLTKISLLLAILVIVLAALTCWKTFFPTGVQRYERIFQGDEMLSIDHFTGRIVKYTEDSKNGSFKIKKEIWDKGDWRRFFINVE